MLRIIIGLIIILVGFVMVWKPRYFAEIIGHQAWAEKIFGPGNDTTAVQVIGILSIFVAFLIMTGLIEGILYFAFSPILKAGRL